MRQLIHYLACFVVLCCIPLGMSNQGQDPPGAAEIKPTNGMPGSQLPMTNLHENKERKNTSVSAAKTNKVDGDCITGSVFVAGQCLVIVDDLPWSAELSWSDAKEECIREGHSLASLIDPQGVSDYLEVKYPGLGDWYYFWLGASDIDKEGSWVWESGLAWPGAAFPWYPGQPDGGSGSNCLAWASNSGYRDVGCISTWDYICEVCTVSSVTGVDVTNPGNRPEELTVSWIEPGSNDCGGGPINGYSITYQVTGESEANSASVTVGTSSYELTGLKPCTNYTVTVAIQLATWTGNAKMTTGATGIQVPGTPLPSIADDSISSSSFSVTWEQEEANSCPIIKYVVEWTSESGDSGDSGDIGGDQSSYNITGLIYNTEYTVAVTAYTADDKLKKSSYINATTDDKETTTLQSTTELTTEPTAEPTNASNGLTTAFQYLLCYLPFFFCKYI